MTYESVGVGGVFFATTPTPPQSLTSTYLNDATVPYRDFEFGGFGRIAGTVKEDGSPDVPVKRRVRLHRERRDARWINHEAPYHAERTLEALSEETGAVLFDCLTVYMCNLLYGKDAPDGEFLERCQVVFDEIDKVLAAARNCGKIVVFVTNEVGSGIVPDNQMAREYRDLAGWVNQRVANEADHVYYCVAGQAVDVKKLAFKFEDEGE